LVFWKLEVLVTTNYTYPEPTPFRVGSVRFEELERDFAPTFNGAARPGLSFWRWGWLCLGPANGKYCLIITRSGFENMLRSASQPAPAVTLPKQVEPTPEMQARLAAICAENGIDLIGPPID